MRGLVLLALLTFALPTATGQTREAPAVELKDLRGRVHRLGDYKGKVVLLNFWVTWCPPCRAEVLDLVRWQRVLENEGLQVIGVSYP